MEQEFLQQLAQDAALIEHALHEQLAAHSVHADLGSAMEYSLLQGGKRIRPILCLETCRLCGGEISAALPFACAVEMIHTYSLIHDDLPAMDNAQLRRAKPTNHMVYGEATAILAGDGLLTAAFEQLTRAKLCAETIVQAVQILSRAAGPLGMVGGQALDMAGEGAVLSRVQLEQLQSLKTGALICAAVELGAVAAGAGERQLVQLRTYAHALGRAFQVRDDMLDVTGSEQQLGKKTGSDFENDKSTFVSALGLRACEEYVQQLTAQAVDAVRGFDAPEFHIRLAKTLAQRSS